jgi:uncharacterized protein (TIGR02594 family)
MIKGVSFTTPLFVKNLFTPIIFFFCIAFLAFFPLSSMAAGSSSSVSHDKPASQTAVLIAQRELGHGETTGNNRGSDIRRYLQGKENLPWCAGFVSHVLKQANITTYPYTLSSLKYYKTAKEKRLLTNNPQAGDLIIFTRQGGGHIGIIEKVDNNFIYTVEGNVGNYPSKVKRVIYRKGNIKNLLGFAKIKEAQR